MFYNIKVEKTDISGAFLAILACLPYNTEHFLTTLTRTLSSVIGNN